MCEENKDNNMDYNTLVNEIADSYMDRMRKGEKITITTILADLISAIMERERRIYLENTDDNANGYYSRRLQLAIGKLDLKIPRVRYSNTFRPSLLPKAWRRVDKDYENIILALLTNGYSKVDMERALHALDMPYSEDRVKEIIELIHEKLDAYKNMPIKDKLFAVFIDA
ncbi:MAG: hypothetical protein KatS3mg003_0729 [Candidatus Nitrosocaldaceae archaeon]|nr:MAG: hypothetical protein KatS3mg003_0729 [Candidatus Nitrosocaldaceae archaeon]